MDKREFRQIKYIRRDMDKIERQLNRKRKPPQGQEQADLIDQWHVLNDQLINAEEFFDDAIHALDDPRLRCIFLAVFFNEEKQRDVADQWQLSEQRICNLIREGIEELNKKRCRILQRRDYSFSRSIR